MNTPNQKSEAFIKITRGAFTMIDPEDYDRVSKYKWNLCGRYVRGSVNGKTISLHRFILNYSGKRVVDHKNGDGLDNRKSNLRICSVSRNVINSKVRSDNTSGYTGVLYEKGKKDEKKWRVSYSVNKVNTSSKYFLTKEEAIACRAKLAKKYYKEFTYEQSRKN